MAESWPRWAQLSYATFDDGRGRGGWQVKETSGGLTPTEEAQLRTRVTTAFDPHVPLPSFPTEVELLDLPTRLAYEYRDDGSAVFAHAALAGNDSTGRPGNVFSQVILDRSASAQTAGDRPIDLWRSPDLLVPFGADRVLAALLPPAPLTAGPLAGLPSAIDFVATADWRRIAVLGVLLDAVLAALAGGSRVVIVADEPDVVARWIAMVTRLTAPGIAHRFSWSVYERASGLDDVWARGIHLAGVPRVDEAVVSAMPDLVVIQDGEQPKLGQLDHAPHVTAAGSQVIVTRWSEMAQMTLIDPDAGARIIHRLDEICRSVHADLVSPAWPFAMTVISLRPEMEDGVAAATGIILSSTPDSIRDNPALYSAAATVVEESTGSTQEAWEALQATRGGAGGVIADLVAVAYLQRAIVDRSWLARSGTVPLPAETLWTPPLAGSRVGSGALASVAPGSEAYARLRSVGATALDDALADESVPTGAELETALHHLHLVEILVRTGVVDPGQTEVDPLIERALDLLAGSTARALATPGIGGMLVREAGDVSLAVRDLLVRPALDSAWTDRAGAPIGGLADPEVLRWLSTEQAAARIGSIAQDDEAHVEVIDREISLTLLEDVGVGPAIIAVAARGALASVGGWSLLPATLQRTLQEKPFSAATICLLESLYPGEIPEAMLRRVIACRPWNDSLDLLTKIISARSVNDITTMMARARRAAAAVVAGSIAIVGTDGANDLALLGRLHHHYGSDLDRDGFAPRFMELAVASASADPLQHPVSWSAETVRFYAEAPTVPLAAPRIVLRMEQPRTIAAYAVLAVLTEPDMGSNNGAFIGSAVRALGAVRLPDGGRLVEQVLRPVLTRPGFDRDAIGAALIARIAGLSIEEDRQSQRRLTEVERGAKSWWQSFAGTDNTAGRFGLFGALRAGERKER